jgi:hypothetical protein
MQLFVCAVLLVTTALGYESSMADGIASSFNVSCRKDRWSLHAVRTVPKLATLRHGSDYLGHNITFTGFPKLRLNYMNNGKGYLVYTYVNKVSVNLGFHLERSLKRHGVPHLLFLCETPEVCKTLKKRHAYYWQPIPLQLSFRRAALVFDTLKKNYWGQSSWVRANFDRHLVRAGVNIVCIDADVLIGRDPRPVLFNDATDMSVSMEWRTFKPWIWSHSLMKLPGRSEDCHSVHDSHVPEQSFVCINNGVMRLDSNKRTRTFVELVRNRSLVEMASSRYSGWDQSAIGRVFFEARVTFDMQTMVRIQSENALISDRNQLNMSVLSFEPQIPNALSNYTKLNKGNDTASFVCHAIGLRKSWNVKAAWLQQSCGEGDAQREHSLDE